MWKCWACDPQYESNIWKTNLIKPIITKIFDFAILTNELLKSLRAVSVNIDSRWNKWGYNFLQSNWIIKRYQIWLLVFIVHRLSLDLLRKGIWCIYIATTLFSNRNNNKWNSEFMLTKAVVLAYTYLRSDIPFVLQILRVY